MAAGFSTGIEATPFLDHINRRRHFLGCFVWHIHSDEQKLACPYGQPTLDLRCSRLQLLRQKSALRRLPWFPSPRVGFVVVAQEIGLHCRKFHRPSWTQCRAALHGEARRIANIAKLPELLRKP
jgi:hypothetical protein